MRKKELARRITLAEEEIDELRATLSGLAKRFIQTKALVESIVEAVPGLEYAPPKERRKSFFGAAGGPVAVWAEDDK